MPNKPSSPATSDAGNGRRASDAMRLRFDNAALHSAAGGSSAFTPEEMEMIDLDAILPPGSEEDFKKPASASTTPPALHAEQKKLRLQLVKFKQSFDHFTPGAALSQIDIRSMKRGDVVEIKTIVGSIYLRILDRLRGERPGAGEILCECHYDLSDQNNLIHTACIQLPLCSHRQVIITPEGNKRLASRAVKMRTETSLPPQIEKLLHESFFTDIVVHANPQPEKLRLIDIGRWLLRIVFKIKAVIDENNRRERAKEEARQRKKEEKRLAAVAARQSKNPD